MAIHFLVITGPLNLDPPSHHPNPYSSSRSNIPTLTPATRTPRHAPPILTSAPATRNPRHSPPIPTLAHATRTPRHAPPILTSTPATRTPVTLLPSPP